MTTLREAAQQALEALQEYQYKGAPFLACDGAVAALRASLAQQAEPVETVREPVAWIHTDLDKPRVKFLEWSEDEPGYRGRWIKTPLYTTPPKRQPLSGLEVERLLEQVIGSLPAARNLVRAVERAHGIGEQP